MFVFWQILPNCFCFHAKVKIVSKHKNKMIYKNLIICGIILNLLWTNVICSKKNYLRGIDIIKMLENSERRMTTKLSGSKYSCNNKQDEGHYVHKDCRKYWHCLYVGTVFEEALERKCPVGTMFHPIQRICEMSPMVFF